MELTADLWQQAAVALESMPHEISWSDRGGHGIEVIPGFFNIYNTFTGQSKDCLLHLASGWLFKDDWSEVPTSASGRVLGTVVFDGDEYTVRLPYFDYYDADSDADCRLIAQEYVWGENCGCPSSWCEHVEIVAKVVPCFDPHNGNWKIVDREIVFFDFDGMEIKE